jgi:hypothetical protein
MLWLTWQITGTWPWIFYVLTVAQPCTSGQAGVPVQRARRASQAGQTGPAGQASWPGWLRWQWDGCMEKMKTSRKGWQHCRDPWCPPARVEEALSLWPYHGCSVGVLIFLWVFG